MELWSAIYNSDGPASASLMLMTTMTNDEVCNYSVGSELGAPDAVRYLRKVRSPAADELCWLTRHQTASSGHVV